MAQNLGQLFQSASQALGIMSSGTSGSSSGGVMGSILNQLGMNDQGGLGKNLGEQVDGETDEQRKKRLRDQQTGSVAPGGGAAFDLSEAWVDFNTDVAEMRETWQVRALIAAKDRYVGLSLLSVLAHNYDEAMHVLMRVAFPGFQSITAPFLCTCGKVDKTGAVVADVVNPDGTITRDFDVYPNELYLRDDFRKLADKLKLNDTDRTEMFKCVQRWVVADRRLDPNMDPRDPDAKRLTH